MRTFARAASLAFLLIGAVAPRAWAAPPKPEAPATIPGWIGPVDVSNELASAKIAAHGRTLARATVSTPNQAAFDYRWYDLDLHPNPATSVLTATVRALATVVTGPVTMIDLDFASASMTVDATTCAGFPAAFTHASNLLTITLDRPYSTGETVDVTVAYHGTPNTGAFGGAFTFFTHSGTPLITTLSEPFDARQWWPCKDDPADKADSVMVRVTLPSGMITASNGVLRESTDNGTIAYRRWATRHPISTYLVSIASFAYAVSSDTYVPPVGDPMPIQFFLFPEHVASSAAVNAKVKLMLGAYGTRFGEYRFLDEKYGEAEFTWGGGMENQTCTSLGVFSESVVAHELGHEWFGDAVTCRDFHHIWLNEGFATYCEALWAEAQGGAPAYATSMAAKRYTGNGTVYCSDLSNNSRIFSTNLSYYKGSWVLHMLRHVMGDAAFFSALQAYITQFSGGNATTEDFRQVCETASGRDLSAFFQEWVYGEYYPQYRAVWWSAAALGGGYDVTLQLQQTQTWQRFAMPVDVRIQTASGPQNFVVDDGAAEVQFFTLHVNDTPTSLAVDPDNWILQSTSYPTAVAEGAPVPAPSLALAPPRPNPSPGPAFFDWTAPRAGRARLEVFDASGRRVKTLLDGLVTAGPHTSAWDGREASGRALGAGLYWAVLDFEGARISRRLALIP